MKKYAFLLVFFAWAAMAIVPILYEINSDKEKVEYTVVQKMQPIGTKSGSLYEIVLRNTKGAMTEKTVAASIYVEAKEGEKIYFYERKKQIPILEIWYFSTILLLVYLLIELLSGAENE